MKILQVNTFDKARGGAAGSAWNLFEGYRNAGHKSWLAVGWKRSKDPDVFELPNDRYCSAWARTFRAIGRAARGMELPGGWRFMRMMDWLAEPGRQSRRAKGHEDFDYPASRCLLKLLPSTPDILHCHNLHGPEGGYFDLRALPALSKSVPVILNLRDTWMLTGHCGYWLDCERWKSGCGNCPYLDLYPEIPRDATRENLAQKKDVYQQGNYFVTAPSQWLLDCVSDSVLAGHPRKCIPNGIDTDTFSPGDKANARIICKLPQDEFIFLCASNNLTKHPIKDYPTIEKAFREFCVSTPHKATLLCMGGEENTTEFAPGKTIRQLGYISDPAELAVYYRAADLFVHSAKNEAFGKVVAEALACGTPVVATACGGISEQIRSMDIGLDWKPGPLLNKPVRFYDTAEAHGILTPPGDAHAMARAFDFYYKSKFTRQRHGNNGASFAAANFALTKQIESFLEWYQEILSS